MSPRCEPSCQGHEVQDSGRPCFSIICLQQALPSPQLGCVLTLTTAILASDPNLTALSPAPSPPQATAVTVRFYGLVHWEDPRTSSSGPIPCHCSHSRQHHQRRHAALQGGHLLPGQGALEDLLRGRSGESSGPEAGVGDSTLLPTGTCELRVVRPHRAQGSPGHLLGAD